MKRAIFVFFILVNILQASTINTAEYKEALLSFKTKNYEKSYEQFSKIFIHNMDNSLVNFYLGRSAYELKKYEFALSAYDRILINDPNNTRVRLELAQTYLQMKLFIQALKEFEIVLQDKMPVQVKKRVEANISFIKAKQQKHFFNITAILGVTYDSNVELSSSSSTFDIYSPTFNTNFTLTNDNEERSALIYQLLLPISHKYKFNENFILNSSIVPLMMRYSNFKNKNIDAVSLDVTPTYYAKDYKLSLSFLYDLVYLGQEKYQSNYYIKPIFTKILANNLINEISFKIGKVDYVNDELKNSNHYEFSNNIKYANEKLGIFDFDIILGKELEIEDSRTDVSQKFYNLKLSNSHNLQDDLTLKLAYSYKKTTYIDEDVNFLSKREDKKHNYSLDFQKELSNKLSMSIGTTFTDNKSNQTPYVYDKYTVKTFFYYSF